jgi:acetyl-CoA acetyltransferase family protein
LKEIVIINGARTAIGKIQGSLKNFTSAELGVISAKEALKRGGISPERIDHIIVGNCIQSHTGSPYIAREIGIGVGIPKDRPAYTVNRICASGMEAVVSGAYMLMVGEVEAVLAVGTESMSQGPFVLRRARDGYRLSSEPILEDTTWTALIDPITKLSMIMTAENLAKKYNISREEADEFAYLSIMRAKRATELARFKEEIVPIEVREKSEVRIFDEDEHFRRDQTRDSLAKLKPVVKDDGIITAANACGVSDGASALVIATADFAEREGLNPMAKIVSWATVGVDPKFMGIGPVPATRIALEKAKMKLDQIELVEINEAFSPQYLACERELKIDREIANVNGGAIALGHPLGCTGNRIILTLMYELRKQKKRYGLATLCVGGGQGQALIIENIRI